MKNTITLALCLFVSSLFGQDITITTPRTALIYKVGKNKRLYQSYFGLRKANGQYSDQRSEAFATGGMDFEFEPAIRAVHHDGNPSLELKYQQNKQFVLPDSTKRTDIYLFDEVYHTQVILHFLSYPGSDVLKTWTTISNPTQQDLLLTHFASAMLHFKSTNYWLTQFHGDWANEMQLQEHRLTSGIKTIDSKLIARADKYQAPHFFISVGEQAATEDKGEVMLGSLAYSGNFKLNFEIDNRNTLHGTFGINNYASSYTLHAQDSLVTPDFIFVYSGEGKGQASRALHHWARKYQVMDGQQPRLTLLNNWEATGMKFNEEKLAQLMKQASELGVDLFLLDDGWFGDKYPRDQDNSSLGDWVVDKKKLPNGISYLVKTAKKNKIKFGIWLEPEMISPKSQLFETHPDWVLQLPNRATHLQRNQLVLDLANPQVQDYLFSVVDDLFKENPNIAYIKWDCNRTVTNGYSPYLKDQQALMAISYVRGLYQVLQRLRAKYPNVPFMLCSGGGGRVDYEALKYFTEFWPSDNTDGLKRVYIQWGYSYFFPANTIAAHVTSWGKQSLKFRTDVAMSGKLGYDIDIAHFSNDEKTFSRNAVQNYKRLATLIEQGDLYRLLSPYEGNQAALMYVNEQKDKALLFVYYLDKQQAKQSNHLLLKGLDSHKNYEIREINRWLAEPTAWQSFSGTHLLSQGFALDKDQIGQLSSKVFEIRLAKTK